LTALEPSPAHCDFRWNVLAWNRAGHLVDQLTHPARNIVWHHFANPAFRRIMVKLGMKPEMLEPHGEQTT
jgi:hypothetical protein